MNAVVAPDELETLRALRSDYRELKVHYRMVDTRGHELMKEARAKSTEANTYFDEAQRIREQFQLLERLHPGVCK